MDSLKTSNINAKIKFSNINNTVEIDSIPYRRMVLKEIDVIFHDQNNQTLIGHSQGIYRFDNNMEMDYNNPFYTLIKKVTVGYDSVVFNGVYYKKNEQNNFFAVSNQQNEEFVPTLAYKFNTIRFSYASPYFIGEKQILYSYKLEGFDEKFSIWTNETKTKYTNLPEGEYKFIVKSKNIFGIESEVATYEFQILPPWYRTIWAYLIYVSLAVLIVWVIVKLNSRRLVKQKKELEKTVKERTAQIVKQKEAIEHKNKTLEVQKQEIEYKNEEITASILYAQRIQKAILPHDNYLSNFTPEHFILFRPRDIVSGDFYWFYQTENKIFIVAADCTGHGVPGAFMSMLGVAFLNEIVKIHNNKNTGEILEKLREKIKSSLHQTEGSNQKDGMDLALYSVDLTTLKLQFSGAYNPVFIIRNQKIEDIESVEVGKKIKVLRNEANKSMIEIKADRQPIGIHIKEVEFSAYDFQLLPNDKLYTFSDGFPDQPGGELDKKFMTKNFKKLLFDIYEKPMLEQKEILNKTIEGWIGKGEQIDDVLVVGVKF